VVEGNADESVHIQFQKFSKGIFKNRALIRVKKSKNKYTINTGPEFANELVRVVAEKLGGVKTKITGAIISTTDLKNELNFKEVKQFQGVKRYLIDFEMSGNEILDLLEKFPKNFFALSLTANENNVLKIKPKAPKSGKPGKGDEEPKADFCKFVTTDTEIARSLIFEKSDFKEAKTKHTFIIEKIEIPETIKDSKDFALVRENSLRIGKIIRHSEIDGVKEEKEFAFRA